MRRILTLAGSVILLTGLAFADEWIGQLVDASCTSDHGGAHACDPGVNTTAFGLVVEGQEYLFDGKGNTKAMNAMRHRAAEAAGADRQPSTPVNVRVVGKQAGKTILVGRIVVQ